MNIFKIGTLNGRKLPASLAEKIILTNWFAVAVFAAFFSYSLVYIYLQQPIIVGVMVLGVILTPCVVLLNHWGYFVLARFLMLSICNIAVITSDICLKFEVSAEAYYFPACLAAFLLFDFSERKYIFSSLTWPILFWGLPRLLHLNNLDLAPLLTADQKNFLILQNFFGALMLTIYCAYTFLRSLGEFQKSIVNSNKLSALGEMSAGIAHEINNPLAIILARTTMMKKRLTNQKFEPSEIIEDIQKVEKTAQRISKIVKGLKNFSRSDENDPLQPADVNSIIDDVLSLCQDRLKNRGIRVETVLVPESIIDCRSYQIAQVIMNLINNASDAIEGHAEPWIQLQVIKTGASLEISITDSGSGIPPEIVKKMMQPFFTTKEVGKGTGLGLSISKGILESHHGSLFYDNKCPNTRFVLALPLSQRKPGMDLSGKAS